MNYNQQNSDGKYEIDEESRTITLTDYTELPILCYYWTGSRNKPYRSQKVYGMARDFKPKAGQITLSSIIGRAILREMACTDTGTLTVPDCPEPCQIGLYTVTVSSKAHGMQKELPVLCGSTASGQYLDDAACQKLLELPIQNCTVTGNPCAHWLKREGMPHKLDQLVPKEKLVTDQMQQLAPAQAEEIDRLKQSLTTQKAVLIREINQLESRVQEAVSELETVTGDRLKRLAVQKKVNQLRQEYMKRQENQFFDAMRLDMELEEKIKAFAEKEKLTAKVQREFVVIVRCSNV